MSDDNTTDIIFAKTRHHYQSYTDLYRLVELSGFPTCYVDEIDPDSDHTYIVTPDGDEARNAGWPETPRAQIIHYDLEWRLEPVAPIRGVRRYWHMDKFVADTIGVQYAPMGGHLGLREQKPSMGPWYDVAFLGYMVPRRQTVADTLNSLGARVSPSDGWGDARHDIMSRSLIYLHVHQFDNISGLPALRLVVAAAYQLPFLTEKARDYGVFRSGPRIMERAYESFISDSYYDSLFGGNLIVKHDFLRESALALHEFLCYEFTFRKGIKAAV